MKPGKYITPEGEIIDVVQVDSDGRILIYRGDEPCWLNESDCIGWENAEEQKWETRTDLEELGEQPGIKEMLAEEPAASPKKKTVKKTAAKKSATKPKK